MSRVNSSGERLCLDLLARRRHLHRVSAPTTFFGGRCKVGGLFPSSVFLCSVVVAELLYGARRSEQAANSLAHVRAFCSRFTSHPFDDSAADEYSEIRAHLASIGLPIGPNDVMIAAIARANGLILVTHNTREFQRVPGLQIDDWQTS